MEACCPSPDHPIIGPTPEALKMRKYLRFVLYGQIAYIICKSMLFGFISGLFQCITMWIIYVSWATMHWCQTIFLMIIIGMDLFLLFITFTAISGGGVLTFMLFGMLAYDAIAMFVSYKAYSVFKRCFDEQYGGGDQYERLNGGN